MIFVLIAAIFCVMAWTMVWKAAGEDRWPDP